MAKKGTPLWLKLVLLGLFFGGFALNVLLAVGPERIGLDLRLRLAAPHAASTAEDEALRESVLFVAVPLCGGGGSRSGTAFVVAPGVLVTAAHVVGDNVACGSEIRLIDHRLQPLNARLVGYADADDLALLEIDDRDLPPLRLADSTRYQDTAEVVAVVTLGYPLPGAASTPERASMSGRGNISQFHEADGRFITSGLNLNAGNSGGPVLIEPGLDVLGVASAKLDDEVGAGIGYVIPADTVKRFYREKTARELR